MKNLRVWLPGLFPLLCPYPGELVVRQVSRGREGSDLMAMWILRWRWKWPCGSLRREPLDLAWPRMGSEMPPRSLSKKPEHEGGDTTPES